MSSSVWFAAPLAAESQGLAVGSPGMAAVRSNRSAVEAHLRAVESRLLEAGCSRQAADLQPAEADSWRVVYLPVPLWPPASAAEPELRRSAEVSGRALRPA